eukprot:6557380-Lingulodinium_polyedra.AAC.1
MLPVARKALPRPSAFLAQGATCSRWPSNRKVERGRARSHPGWGQGRQREEAAQPVASIHHRQGLGRR